MNFCSAPTCWSPLPHFPTSWTPTRYYFRRSDWYDYWTGERLERQAPQSAKADATSPNPVLVHPKLDILPVYVREGSILPMQALIQSTNEIPQGPLCCAYIRDAIARARSTRMTGRPWRTSAANSCACSSPAKLRQFGQAARWPTPGSYRPWWEELRVEIYGQNSDASYKVVDQRRGPWPGNSRSRASHGERRYC